MIWEPFPANRRLEPSQSVSWMLLPPFLCSQRFIAAHQHSARGWYFRSFHTHRLGSGLLCPAPPAPAAPRAHPPGWWGRKEERPSIRPFLHFSSQKQVFSMEMPTASRLHRPCPARLYLQPTGPAGPVHTERSRLAPVGGQSPGKASGDRAGAGAVSTCRSGTDSRGPVPRSLAGVKNGAAVCPPHPPPCALLGPTGLEVPLAFSGGNSMRRRALPPPPGLHLEELGEGRCQQGLPGAGAVSTCAWSTPGKARCQVLRGSCQQDAWGGGVGAEAGVGSGSRPCPLSWAGKRYRAPDGRSREPGETPGSGEVVGRTPPPPFPPKQQDWCLLAKRTARFLWECWALKDASNTHSEF